MTKPRQRRRPYVCHVSEHPEKTGWIGDWLCVRPTGTSAHKTPGAAHAARRQHIASLRHQRKYGASR